MEMLPSCLVIALSPIVYYYYQKKPVYVRSSPLLWIKLVSHGPNNSLCQLRGIQQHPLTVDCAQGLCSILVIAEAASLALRTLPTEYRTSTSIPAASVELVAAVTIGLIIYMQHRHAIRTSALLAIYLLVGILIDITKSRSYFIRSGQTALGGLAAATGSLRLGLFVFEEVSRRNLISDQNVRNNAGPESTSGWLSRTYFLFLTPMLATGFKKELQSSHLIKLGLDFSSKAMHTKLGKSWSHEDKQKSAHSLFMVCLRTWKYQLLQMFVMRTVQSAFALALPFLLRRLVQIVDQDRNMAHADENRLGILGATILTFIGVTTSRTAYSHQSNRLSTQIRGGLATHLLEKTHNLHEKEAKKSAAMTLMSADIDGIISGLQNCIEIPITAVEIGLGMLFLYIFIGVSCFFILISVLFTTFGSYLLGKRIQPAAASWNQSMELRVAKTSQMLAQLQSIKMIGLGPTVRQFMQNLRVEELHVSAKYRSTVALSVVLVLFADLVTPVIVIAGALFWKGLDGKLAAADIFPTLALVEFVQQPLAAALEAYPRTMAMFASFDRLQQYFSLPERRESRTLRTVSDRSKLTQEISFSDASFGPSGMETPLLSGVNFSLEPGSVTGVLGQTGSGKTTVLDSILGTSAVSSGSIEIDDVKVAYCGQNVWLRDTTIRNNIIEHLPYDPVRFDLAIKSCQLEQDIAQFADGDQHIVGTDGQNLSGGQRQRIGIARTAYAKFAVTIPDDVFSSLDRTTAVLILKALCGEDGLLRNAGSTVILSTYLTESLGVMDDVVFVDGKGSAILQSQCAEDDDHAEKISQILNSTRACLSEQQEIEEQTQVRAVSARVAVANETATEHINTKRKGDRRLYALFIDSVGRIRSALFSLLVFVLSAGEMVPNIYMTAWIEKDPDNSLYFIGYASIAVATCFIGSLTYHLTYNKLGARAAIDLHGQLLDYTMGATLDFISSTSSGNLLNRFSGDALLFARELPGTMMRTMYIFYSVIITIGLILSGASYMSISLPFILAAFYAIQHFYLRTSRQMRHLDLEKRAPLYTFFRETAQGLVYIQSAGWQKENLELGFKLLDESQQTFYLMSCIQQWLSVVMGSLTGVVAVTLVAIALYVKDSTSGSQIGLAFLTILGFNRTIEAFLHSYTHMETSSGALSRLNDFKKSTPQESNKSLVQIPAGWPATGTVEIENLKAQYRSVPCRKKH